MSPHSIIEFVRLWLQQGGGNRHKFKKIVFSAATNPEFAKTLLERYFPLAHYYFRAGTPGSVERSRVTQAERTHNPQDQMGEGEGEGEGEGKEVGEGGEGEMGEWGEEGEGEEGGEGVAVMGEKEENERRQEVDQNEKEKVRISVTCNSICTCMFIPKDYGYTCTHVSTRAMLSILEQA